MIILFSNPGTLNNGDLWATSGITGTILINLRVGGNTKSVELS